MPIRQVHVLILPQFRMLSDNEYGIETLSSKEESKEVLDAVNRNDWAGLRKLSLRPGGFGEERLAAWPFLLHVSSRSSSTKVEAHNQTSSKLRKRRKSKHSSDLNEKETSGGEPSRGSHSESTEEHADERQIKLDTDRSFVLYPADKENEREELQAQLNLLITSVFRRHKRLSYFQGYHDIITVLYLTLTEDLILRCSEKISLHRLRDSMGRGLEPLMGLLQILKYLLRLADPDYAALLERNTPLPYFGLSNLLTLFSHDVPTLELIQHIFDFLLCRPPIATVYLAAALTLRRKEEAFELEREGEEGMLHSLLASLPTLYDAEEEPILPAELTSRKHEEPEEAFVKEEEQTISLPSRETGIEGVNEYGETDKDAKSEVDLRPKIEDQDNIATSDKPCEEELTLQNNSDNILDGNSVHDDSLSDVAPSKPPTRPPSSLSNSSTDHTKVSKVFLPALLKEADELLAKFPPNHPSLHVSSIIGPQSVINTWSEDPNDMSSDEEAEAMILHPELIVLPFVDPDELAAAKESESTGFSDDSDTGRSPGAKHRRKLRKSRRPHRFGHMRHFGVQLDKKTVLTGAVVALGVAAAVYSMRGKPGAAAAAASNGQGGGIYEYVRGAKAWRKTAQWISGAVIGGNEELLGSLGW